VVGISYTSMLCEKSAYVVSNENIHCDVFDIRVLNPLKIENIIESVRRTGRLVVVDGDWATCGMAAEIIAKVMENIKITDLKKSPIRITLPDAPAPTSKVLEQNYYIKESDVINAIKSIIE